MYYAFLLVVSCYILIVNIRRKTEVMEKLKNLISANQDVMFAETLGGPAEELLNRSYIT